MRSSATSGRSSQARSRRLPIDVMRPIELVSSEPSRPPSEPSRISRCFSVVGSMSSPSARCAVGDGADVGEVGLLRVAQVLDQRAGGRDGGGMAVEAEAFEAAGAQLIEQRRGAPIELERPVVERRDGETAARDRRQQRRGAGVDAPRGTMTSRGEHADFLGQRLRARLAGVLGGHELAGREVEEGHAEAIAGPGASASRNAGSRASR